MKINEEGSRFLVYVAYKSLKKTNRSRCRDFCDYMERNFEDDQPGTSGYKIFSEGANGLFTLFEAKLATSDHYYYAGLLVSDTVFLYTNAPIYISGIKRNPKGVEEWIPDMKNIVVIKSY